MSVCVRKKYELGGTQGLFAVSLAFLRAVDAAQTDTFSVGVVEDFDRVTVEFCL